MTPTTIQLLHVEDDRIHQALAAKHLAAMNDYQFAITAVASEEAAIDAFRRGTFDLVLLDYHLTEGDGVSCLRRLRKMDSMIPVIAVSGVATPEVAAQLIEEGADDYLGKSTLDGPTLAQSVRNVLTRAQAFRARFASLAKPRPAASPLQ